MHYPSHVEDFEQLRGLTDELHLAIGIFDGVHLGHKAVIESAVFSARRSGGVSGVLTFDPHPSRLFSPENPTKLIMSLESKTDMLHKIGVDVVIWKRFEPTFASISADDFLTKLKKSLPTLKSICVGENFRFGKKRAGDVATLVKFGNSLGISVFSAERIRHNGEPISSTRIRKELESGRIEAVNDLLGYNYFSKGTVIGGNQLGRKMGVPTLNLNWSPECRPCFGVYHVRFRNLAQTPWAFAVANYGVKPTIEPENQTPLLEVHALEDTDLNQGDSIEVEWLHFIRKEKKFPSQEALFAQIAKDCEIARNFSNHG